MTAGWTHHSFLNDSVEHNNPRAVLLPDHLPEVTAGEAKGSLYTNRKVHIQVPGVSYMPNRAYIHTYIHNIHSHNTCISFDCNIGETGKDTYPRHL